LAVAHGAPAEPLRVDVWGHLHPLLPLVRSFADSPPGAVVEVSTRRSLPKALDAIRRAEIDVAFGNLASAGEPLDRR